MSAWGPRTAGLLLGLLATGAIAQEGFVRTATSRGDVCLWWPERRYAFNVDVVGYTKNDDTVDPRSEFAAIDAAIETWNTIAASCSDFVFERGPDVEDVRVGYDQEAAENSNVITFREVACPDVIPEDDPCWTEGGCANTYRCWDHGDGTIALTSTTHLVGSGTILDADIEFNASRGTDGTTFLFTTVSSPPCDPALEPTWECVATDVQNTFTHEIGHAIGLDHYNVPGSTMERSAPLGETKKRIIDQGTADGFCTIYPRSAATPVICGTAGGLASEIVAVGRGSPGFTTGCSTGAGGPVVGAALLWFWSGLRRRKRRG